VKLNISAAVWPPPGHPTVNQFLRPMAATGWVYMAMVKIRSRKCSSLSALNQTGSQASDFALCDRWELLRASLERNR
jgi:hypothetical protein